MILIYHPVCQNKSDSDLQEMYVDATLACGGKLYAAHKFVLSTCSDYFKQMFTKNPSKHPIVFMKDVTARDLEALLDFMYNGEVNVPQSSLGSLIKTAEGLQIKGLAVPDDPPASKRDREKDRRSNHSPPPKRRARDRSPPTPSPQVPSSLPQSSYHSNSTLHPTSRSRSPSSLPPTSASKTPLPPLETTHDEDSRTSVHSGLSALSEQNVGAKLPDTNEHPMNSEGDDPAPGPSGIHKTEKESEVVSFIRLNKLLTGALECNKNQNYSMKLLVL